MGAVSDRVLWVAVALVAVAAARYAISPALVAVLCLASVCALRSAPPPRRLAIAVMLSLAMLWIVRGVDGVQGRDLHVALSKVTLDLRVRVVGNVSREGGSLRFTAVTNDPTLPRRIRVTWQSPGASRPHQGECWQLRLRLKRLTARDNPGAFDRRPWSQRRGIGAVAQVRPWRRNGPCGSDATAQFAVWRAALGARIGAVMARADAAAVLRAVTLGDRADLPAGTRDVLARTGTAHLVAISGLHVGMVAGLGFVLGRRLAPGTFAHREALALAVGVMLAMGYAALSGFALPAQRALIMLMGVAILRLANRRVAPLRLIALAASVVTLVSPAFVADASFQFSFAAVTVLALCALRMRAKRYAGRSARITVHLQFAVGLVLLPLTVCAFGFATALSLPANLVAVPAFAVVVVPVALLGVAVSLLSVAGAEWLWALCGHAIAVVLDALTWLASTGLGVTEARLPGVDVTLVATVLMAVVALGAALPGRLLAACGLLAVLGSAPEPPEAGCARVAFLAVGHGSAIIVRTAVETVVYDTGPAWPGEATAASRSLLPFLSRASVGAVDVAVLSHADRDHTGGAAVLGAAVPVATWLVGPRVDTVARPARCAAGQRWSAGGLRFHVVWPMPRLWRDVRDNNGSCVVRVTTGDTSLVLAGDVEARAERELVALRAVGAQATTVPHHGSNTSSTPPFVRASGAGIAVVSTDVGGRWSLPAPAVAARWRDAGAEVVTTSRAGVGLALCARRGARLQDPDPWAESRSALW
ncbi:MAG: DNA internalization-related competence protein ComEC/Rec2 [Pseudomonadota bacterium]